MQGERGDGCARQKPAEPKGGGSRWRLFISELFGILGALRLGECDFCVGLGWHGLGQSMARSVASSHAKAKQFSLEFQQGGSSFASVSSKRNRVCRQDKLEKVNEIITVVNEMAGFPSPLPVRLVSGATGCPGTFDEVHGKPSQNSRETFDA